jgi:hypothetical protein
MKLMPVTFLNTAYVNFINLAHKFSLLITPRNAHSLSASRFLEIILAVIFVTNLILLQPLQVFCL